MKRLTAAVLALLLCLGLAACGQKKVDRQDAAAVVSAYFDALKAGDIDAAVTYLEDDSAVTLEQSERDMLKKLYSKLEYEIEGKDSMVSSTESEVKVKVTAANIQDMYQKAQSLYMTVGVGGEGEDATLSAEDQQKVMQDAVDSVQENGLTTSENEVVVGLTLKADGWRIMASEELAMALAGASESEPATSAGEAETTTTAE